MGYTVLPDISDKFGTRKDLEGPWQFGPGRVLYYDPREGKYYDPTTDFYMEQDEMDMLHQYMYDKLIAGATHG